MSLPLDEMKARLLLHQIPKIGTKRFYQLIDYFGSANKALSHGNDWQSAGLPKSCLLESSPQLQIQLDRTLQWLEASAHHVIFWDDSAYPALLKELPDAPPLLFVAGELSLLEKPQIAVVGSRHASKPSLDTAFQFSKALADIGFVVTSGLASGIDGAAHSGALAGTGETIGVLGSGLQHIYPASHKKLAQNIIEQGGALISEFPLFTSPQASNFPRRNRIISGLSLAVLVVEATISSGSLITAKLAAEQGRDVFAIPGSIHHPGAKGCHQLIREGAILVESVGHILEALQGWTNINAVAPTEDVSTAIDNNPIIMALRGQPQTSELLALSLNIPFEELLVSLTDLEIDAKVSCEAGIWYAS